MLLIRDFKENLWRFSKDKDYEDQRQCFLTARTRSLYFPMPIFSLFVPFYFFFI
jgi:hypothetical protein